MCECFVSVADDHVTKDITSSVDCSDVVMHENRSSSKVSVMSQEEGLRRRLYKATKDTRLLHDPDVDKVVGPGLAGEGE